MNPLASVQCRIGLLLIVAMTVSAQETGFYSPPVPRAVRSVPSLKSNPVSENIIERAKTRCPTAAANPSYFEMKAMGYKLMKVGRHREARQCFLDSMNSMLSRVGLYNSMPDEEPTPTQVAQAMPLARQAIQTSQYTQMPAGVPRDPRLGMGPSSQGSALQEDGQSVLQFAGSATDGQGGNQNSRPHSSGGPSFLPTGPGDARSHPYNAFDSQQHQQPASFGGNISPIHDMTSSKPAPSLPWRKESAEAWMTQPRLLARTVQVYNSQLLLQRQMLGVP